MVNCFWKSRTELTEIERDVVAHPPLTPPSRPRVKGSPVAPTLQQPLKYSIDDNRLILFANRRFAVPLRRRLMQ